MEVRAATERWTLALLRCLGDEPTRADLVSPSNAAYALKAAAQADGQRLTVHGAFSQIVRALLGQGEHRHCVASRLPVYDLTGELPNLLDDGHHLAGVMSERDAHLHRVNPGQWTPYECTRLAVGLGVHRRGIAAAFNLSLADLGCVELLPRTAPQEAADLIARVASASAAEVRPYAGRERRKGP